MTNSEYISILGLIISVLISIIGFFIRKNVSDVESGVKKVSDEVYKSKSKIIDEVNNIKNEIFKLQISIKENSLGINYIQKATDSLKEESEVIKNISNRVSIAETNIENIGRVILKKKD